MVAKWWNRWPVWCGTAATVWSAAYCVAGIYWALGGAGFPFGAGDTQAADNGRLLSTATAEVAGPVIAVLGAAGIFVSTAMSRGGERFRPLLLGFGAGLAVLLTLILPEARAVKYLPPLGLLAFLRPPAWGTVNFLILMVGGFVWAGATFAYWRRTGGALDELRVERWGRRATYFAIALPWVYASYRLCWAAGVPIGISPEFLDQLDRANPGHQTRYLELILASFAIGGSLLTIGLLRPWGEVFPRWMIGLSGRRVPPAFPVVFAGLVAFNLTAFGLSLLPGSITYYFGDRMVEGYQLGLLYPLPAFAILAWGICLGLATIAYFLRRRAGHEGRIKAGSSSADRRPGRHPATPSSASTPAE